MTIRLCRLTGTTGLTLVLAAAMACSGQGRTETSAIVPIPASTPFTQPITEPIAETLVPRTGDPATGGTAPSSTGATAPQVNLIWNLSSPGHGPLKAGDELILILDLDPQGLAVGGIQFGLNYPGELLRLREIVPGGILGPDPLVVDKADASDASQGRVLFAIARRGETVGPTGPGRIASIKMLARQEIPENGNVMIWLGRVKLTNSDFQTIGQDSVSWSLTGPG